MAAAESADQVIVSDTIVLEDIIVDDTYQGPRMHRDETDAFHVTPDFVLALMQAFKDQKILHRRFVMTILLQFQRLQRELLSLVDVDVPPGSKITVCGDTHGQFYDLLHIFELNGNPSIDNPYVFNGDFVDRGSFSVEVILTLMAWKVLEPECIHLTRGNHEAQSLNKIYGFEGEVKAKYNMQVMEVFRCALHSVCLPALMCNLIVIAAQMAHVEWCAMRIAVHAHWVLAHFILSFAAHIGVHTCSEAAATFTGTAPLHLSTTSVACSETFCWLPLAFCLKGKVLVLHGGLFSSDDVTLDDIRKVDRFREPPDSGIMCESLWSDPKPDAGRAPSKRGCGIQFGATSIWAPVEAARMHSVSVLCVSGCC
jgi:diadenosine tetraphosphatase ApaH/serine/threonine PP2A family protein phosphatase